MLKKVLSVTLVIVMLFTVCSVGFSASAADFAGYTAVSTKEDLYNIRNNTSGKYYLTNDIVFDSTDANWAPIESFSGILDGNGYSIKGLQINSTAFADYLGIGMINKMYGTICNLTMDGCKITYYTDRYSTNVENAILCIGTIAGINYGRIENCHNTSEVSATAEYQSSGIYAGGIAGGNYEGTIINCSNSGKVYSSYYLGGIAGYAFCSDVADCNNSAYLYTYYKYACAGGIVGLSENSVVTGCYNTGDIEACYRSSDPYDFSNNVGGIVADMVKYKKYDHEASITNCYNIGSIFATQFAGGILGLSDEGSIDKCFNTGTVVCDYTSGGIIGYLFDSTLSNCFNVASVISTTDMPRYVKVGGLAGSTSSAVMKNSYNVAPAIAAGTSSDMTYVGSICGDSVNTTYTNVYYYNMFNDKGVERGKDTTKAIATYLELSMKESYSGFDFNSIWKLDYSTGFSFPMLRGMDYPNIGLDWQLALTKERNSGVTVEHTGKCGDNLTWTIYDTGLLYITGTGDMYDYSKSYPAPWSKYSFEKVAAVANGVTSVGDYAFYNCDKLATVFLGYDVERIGESAFENCDNLVTAVINEKINYIEKNAFADCPNYIGTEFIGHIVQFYAVHDEGGNSSAFSKVRGAQTGNTNTIDLINPASKTSLNYGDVLWLTVDESKVPEGCSVMWFTANAFFTLYAEDGNDIAIQNVSKGGKDTVYAMIVDENFVAVRDENGEIMVDCVEIQTNYNFFMLIIYWIRTLFGIVRTYT